MRAWATLLVLVVATLSAAASAQDADPAEHFASGTRSLYAGEFQAAIEQLEAHADRGAPHPDASFNRGLAYVMRVRSGAERSGDLGRAAAAFEEALLLRPGDAEAEEALKLVHAEVARRRSRRGQDVMMARPSLDRTLVGLASERTWALAAVVSSLLLALGMLLWSRRRGPAHLAGTVLAPVALLALVALMPLYFGARHLRQSTQPAVLVQREAHLTDEEGTRQEGEPLPEAARLEVGERHGRLVHVRWGSVEGWVPASAVRLLRVR